MQLLAKEEHNILKFKCKNCGYCCDHTLIELYPFDIKALCERKNISTKEFHQSHAVVRPDDHGIPKCVLINKPSCHFKENNLCTVYSSRPVRCRLYPLGRIFGEEQLLYVVSEYKCVGFDTGKKRPIVQFLEEQGVTPFNKLVKDWTDFLRKMQEKELKNDPVLQTIFRKVFYDFDDLLIKKYRERLRKEETTEDFMGNLYEIFQMLMERAPGKQ